MGRPRVVVEWFNAWNGPRLLGGLTPSDVVIAVCSRFITIDKENGILVDVMLTKFGLADIRRENLLKFTRLL